MNELHHTPLFIILILNEDIVLENEDYCFRNYFFDIYYKYYYNAPQ